MHPSLPSKNKFLHVIFTTKLIICNFYKQTTKNARPLNWAMHALGLYVVETLAAIASN